MSFRLVLNLCYLLALLLSCGYLYHHLTHFAGHIAVATGGTERLVVREAQGGYFSVHRAMPPELLRFRDPRAERFLDPNEVYDSATLPFLLRLDEIEILAEHPPHDALEWELGRRTESHPVAPGDRVCFQEDDCVEVMALVPWSGILFQPGGAPMISLVFSNENTEQRQMIETGQHVVVAGAPVFFRWSATEEDARAALGEELPDAIQTRWGVEENGAMTWMSNPSPGQGLTTQDGREITVLAAQPAPANAPRLELEIRAADGAVRHVVLQPGEDAEHGLRFEAPRHAPRTLVIHGYPGEEVIVGDYGRGVRRETLAIPVGGEGIALHEGRLRVEQMMAAAIPIVAEDNAIFALEVASDTGRHTLREGDRVPWQDGYLRYRRKPTAPEVAGTLSALDAGETIATGRIAPGDWMRFENWYFRIASTQHAPQLLFLEAHRSGFARPSTRIGLALFVLGAFGLVIVRFYRRPGGERAE